MHTANRQLLPDFLIVGAPRCGTTWLRVNLAAHPDIFMPRGREIHFFDQNYEKGLDWYKAFFRGAETVIKGEATPGYLYPPDVVGRMKKHIPWASLIIILRHPVERAYSHYWFRERERRQAGASLSFEEKIRKTPRLINEGFYARHLEKFIVAFGQERVAIFLNEDIRSDPEALLCAAYCFLGVDSSFRPAMLRSEINSSAIKAGRSSMLYNLNRAMLKLGLPRMAHLAGRLNRQSPPKLSPATHNMLVEKYYLEDIDRLEILIDRDLSTWKQPVL